MYVFPYVKKKQKNKLFSEEKRVLQHCLKLEKWQDPDTYKHRLSLKFKELLFFSLFRQKKWSQWRSFCSPQYFFTFQHYRVLLLKDLINHSKLFKFDKMLSNPNSSIRCNIKTFTFTLKKEPYQPLLSHKEYNFELFQIQQSVLLNVTCTLDDQDSC